MDLHLRLENHWLACMATAGGGGPVTRLAGAVVVASPAVPGMSFNFIALRNVAPGRLAAVLELGGVLLAEHCRPPAAFLSPAAGDMAALGEALAVLGWRRLVRQSVLVCELPAAAEAVSEIRVEPVAPAEVGRWGETLVSAYEVDPITGEALSTAWGSILRTPGEGCWAQGCLAWWHDRPVGTGLTWSQGDIAGLYCGAVLPEFRRRGIERATVLHRLSEAAARGCRLAALQTESGSPVEHLCVDRLGFTRAYERELWSPYTATLHCE